MMTFSMGKHLFFGFIPIYLKLCVNNHDYHAYNDLIFEEDWLVTFRHTQSNTDSIEMKKKNAHVNYAHKNGSFYSKSNNVFFN